MLCYVSVANNHTGAWIGAVIVNKPTEEEAQDYAAGLARADPQCPCVQTVCVRIKPGSPPIPAELIGRLLTKADLEVISPGDPGNLAAIRVS
jgi:hypothetical protein